MLGLFMFNVRIKRFLDTEQIQIYSAPLNSHGVDRIRFSKETGEIFPFERGHLKYNPFDDKLEYMCNMGDSERSLSVSRSRTIHKIYDIAKSNQWDWFFTLTFNPDKVDSFDYALCTKKLSQWLKNMKKQSQDMKYIVVPEQHKSGRWHFHGLFANVDNMVFIDSGIVKNGKRIYNVGSYRFGFSTATKIEDLSKTVSYLCKYITKDLCINTKGKKRYWASRNVSLPEVYQYLVPLNGDVMEEILKDGLFIKKVHSEFADVQYIEKNIYTTNLNMFVQNNVSNDNEE